MKNKLKENKLASGHKKDFIILEKFIYKKMKK